MENKIRSLLCEIKICDDESIAPFYPRVRDRDDVGVLKCNKSGVIFLSRTDHMDMDYYHEQDSFKYWDADERKRAVIGCLDDNQRRRDQFQQLVSNKVWMDVGTGAGGILDLLSPFAAKTMAVEPQNQARAALKDSGYEAFASVEEVPADDIDVVSLFHVFEHITDPVEMLKGLKKKMKKGAKLVIEVPHANDFLISFLDVEPFKAFTFWSEHLILHTRQSLQLFLEAAGFSNVSIKGFQRYTLANHLYWQSKGEPGGHQKWDQIGSDALHTEYSNMLLSLDKTDTLIAIAEV